VHPISSMLRVAVIVCLVALCAASQEGAMKQYAHVKILESCMGAEYIQGFITGMKDSSAKCSTQPRLYQASEIDFQDVIDEVKAMALPWGSRQDTADQYFQLVASPSRSKRHASEEKHSHTTAEKLDLMREKMACMIGNMTCMLRDLKWMNEDNTPNMPYYATEINNIPNPKPGLIDDLTWGMDVCRDFSMCMSPERAKSPFMKMLGNFISFQKCFQMKELMACMKADFKEYAKKDGYDNVDDILDLGFGMVVDMAQMKEEKIGMNTLEGAMSGDLIF